MRLRLFQLCAALVLLFGFGRTAFAGNVTLAWDPSPGGDVAGYIIVYGTTPGSYPYALEVGNNTFATVSGLASGVTYYFAVQAYSTLGVLSPASNEVSASTTNSPPVLSDPGSQQSSEGSPVHVQLSATDPDGDPLRFGGSDLPDGLSVDSATGVISGTSSFLAAGVYSVTLSVSDGFVPGALTTTRTVTWTVLNVNGPPLVATIPNQTSAENQLVTLNVTAADPDGDAISWSAAGLPAGLSMNPSTGAISGTPSFTSAGVHPVTVIATAAGMEGRHTFDWTITNTDRPPVLSVIPDQASGQYASVLLQLTASDPDGDGLAFSATGLPSSLAINPATGRISGTLSPANIGSYSVSVTASAGGLSASRTFAWTVTNQVAFPLKVSANGRYLVDQNNIPFLMSGDAPQTIVGNLSLADATTFLNDRKARGFNTVWINLICRTANYGCSATGNTIEGIMPFSTADDLSTPNEAYFAKADAILTVAANLNMLVILDPIDTGGWLTTMTGSSLATLRAYGQYVGNRYKNFPNIIWMSGNDFQSWRTEANDAKVREVALGIKDVDTGHIHTVLLDWYSSSSLDDVTWAPIIKLEAAYSYYPTYREVLKAYNRSSGVPVFFAEGNYESENIFSTTDIDVPVRLRRQAYWSALSGTTGQLFGNKYSWTFASGWQSNLNTPGATQFGYLKSLLEPRAWFKLIPDQSHSVLTSGYGTYAPAPTGLAASGTNSVLGNDYATAAATPDGSLVMAYLPTVRTVTVDMSRLSGTSVARWFDPALGTFVSIAGSPFANSGTANFTPPGAHADGSGDWVLVIESDPGIVLANPGDRSNPRGAVISLQLVASDPYGDPLTYSATNLPTGLSINPSTGLISGALTGTQLTTYNVTVSATDGTLTASRSFNWTVTLNNDPPVLTNPGNQTNPGGSTVALQLSATDADGLGLFYSATGLPPGLSVNSSTGLISGTLSSTTAVYNVTATVSDGVLSATQNFVWTVVLGSSFVQMNFATPQAPTSTVVVPFTLAQTAGNLNVVIVGWADATRQVQSITDTKGNAYVLAVGPTIRAGASTQSIYYAKNILAAGADENSVTVTFNGAAVFPDIRIAEYRGIDPVNPVDATAAATGSSSLSSSGSLTTTSANDVLVAGNLVATLTAGAGPDYTQRVITSPDGDILMDRLVQTAGTYSATAPLVSSGGWIMQLVAFRAVGGALNQAPTLSPISDQTSSEGSTASVQLTGGDPNGNAITYSAVNLPPQVTINPLTGLMSGPLSFTSAGVYSVTVTVSDQSLTTSRSFTWTVTNVNRPPTITLLADRTGLEYTSATLTVAASDPDNDTLTYSATGLPPGLSINPASGVISGTMSYSSAGQHLVTVTVNDGQGGSVITTFYWTVTNVDRSPVLAAIPNQASAEGDSITLNLVATDPDTDDTLIFSATGLPSGLSINTATGVIAGTLSYTSAGPHFVTAKVFDGTVTVSQSFVWTVTNVNRAPVFASIADQTSPENAIVSVTAYAPDPDGDAVTFLAAGLPPGVTIGLTSGVMSGSLSYASAGTYNVTITASDGPLGSNRSFTWTVTNLNRAPLVAAMGNLSTVAAAPVSLPATATDPDGDSILYGATGLPLGVAIDPGSGLITGAPLAAAVYNVTILALDGTTSSSTSFVWKVTAEPAARVTFIQAHSSSLFNAAASVTVSYPVAQVQGSLAVVVVGWKDPSAQVLSVVDATGNIYQPAVGPTTRSEIGTQSIYYAANIAAAGAGANAVTVTFTSPALKAEVRVVEYQGIEPTNVVDVTAGAQGNSGQADSGPVTTTFRNDLLFGAVWSSWATTMPEDGLTARLTTASGALLEDATVNALGTYHVRASIDPPSPWILQMVAFRDANHAPTLNNPGTQTTLSNVFVSLPLVFNDVDGDTLTFSATGLPLGVTINTATGVISGTVALSAAGVTYNVTASVFDGVLTTNAAFQWNVIAPSVSVSGVFNPGFPATINWSSIGSPTATDWIGVFTPGAADTAATVYWFTTGTTSGSRVITVPSTLAPGTYDLRLFAHNTYQRLAVGSVSVSAATLHASPTTIGVGGTVTASWSAVGSPTATDWIVLAATGAPDTSYIAWGNTTGTSNGSRGIAVPLSATPGTYELRLFAAGAFRRLATSETITVQATTLTAGPSTVVAGDSVNAAWAAIGAPTATDWLILVKTGSPDNAWVAWGYTNGAGTGSRTLTMPKSAAPGTYELRLFSNNTTKRLAVSNTITVPGVALTASPTMLAPGGTLTVSWQNLGNPSKTDWLALVPVGAADAAWVAWIYATGRGQDATLLTVPANLSPGNYEVRMFANNSAKRLAISNTVTVTGIGPTLATSPVSTAPGGTLTLSWRNIASPTAADWIGLYPVGATDASYISRIYTSGRATDRMLMTLPGDISTGSYELRLFANDTFALLAVSNGFEVTSGARLSVNPLTVPAGRTLNVSWAGIASPTTKDWVGLVPVNGADTAYVAWKYTAGAAAGSLGLTIPPTLAAGTYELRLFANDGVQQRLALANLIKVGPTLVTTPTPVAPGGTLTVTWAGISAPTAIDWVGLTPLNAPDSGYLAWIFTGGGAAGSKPLVIPSNLPAGTYDARLFSNNTFVRLALGDVITVTAPGPSVSVSPLTTTSGATITASWKNIAAPTATDWIGVYAAGSADGAFITRVFTGGSANGSTPLTLPAGLASGSYQLRLFSNDTLTRLALGNSFVIP